MFEIELFICIKRNLALNNLQRLIYYKNKQTNKQTSLSSIWTQINGFKFVLFDFLIGPHQLLPLRVRVNQGAMTMKEYFTLSKSPADWTKLLGNLRRNENIKTENSKLVYSCLPEKFLLNVDRFAYLFALAKCDTGSTKII